MNVINTFSYLCYINKWNKWNLKTRKWKNYTELTFNMNTFWVARILQGNLTLFLEKHIKKKKSVEKKKKKCRKKEEAFHSSACKGKMPKSHSNLWCSEVLSTSMPKTCCEDHHFFPLWFMHFKLSCVNMGNVFKNAVKCCSW